MALKGYTIRRLRPSDITALVNDVREVDREEWHIAATRCGMGDRSLFELVSISANEAAISRVLVHDETDAVLCIWGAYRRPEPGMGGAWLIGTKEGAKRVMAVQRHFREGLSELHREFPVLEATPWLGNPLHIRWLYKLGFHYNGHSETLRGFVKLVHREPVGNVR